MKFAYYILLLMLCFLSSAAAQTNDASDLRKMKTDEAAPEVEEALQDFDFRKLRIAPNNLRPADIENLAANFLASVKPFIVKNGEPVKRLQRLAEPVFLFHRSAKSRTVVYESKIPTVFTWKETFVTFSTAALDILSDKEITALLGHEIGHLYFAEAFARAAHENDNRRLRIIELKCDLVALETLSKLKIKRSKLISAVERLIQERTKLKAESFQPGSPSLRNREALTKIYLESN